MARTVKRFVLPTPAEFIRHVARMLLLNHRDERDTDTEMMPIVTRAKTLTEKKGLIVATAEKEE